MFNKLLYDKIVKGDLVSSRFWGLDNNNTIIAVCVLCLLMTLLFACSRGCSQKTEKKEVVTQPKIFRPEKEDKHYSEKTYSSSSSKSSSYGKPPALLSRDDKEDIIYEYIPVFNKPRTVIVVSLVIKLIIERVNRSLFLPRPLIVNK